MTDLLAPKQAIAFVQAALGWLMRCSGFARQPDHDRRQGMLKMQARQQQVHQPQDEGDMRAQSGGSPDWVITLNLKLDAADPCAVK